MALFISLITGITGNLSQTVMAADKAPVTITEVRLQPLTETVPLNGTITTKRESALSPRLSGLVSRVHVDAGDRVETGQRLVEFDTQLAQLALEQAEAAVSEARARLAEAQRLRDEAYKLEGSRTIPETQLRAAEADVAINRATVQRLEVEQRVQAERLRRHTLYAPFDGVIARKLAETGEWVDTGTAVLELVDTRNLRLDIRAPQQLYQSIADDMTVNVRSEAFPDHELTGHVHARVPVNDPTARTFLVRLHIDDPDDHLLPGMSARAFFTTGQQQQGLVIPRDAVTRMPGGTAHVWIIEHGDTATTVGRRQIKLGRTMANDVEVSDGLSAGDTVVLEGNEILSEGQAVRIINDSINRPDNQ